MGEHQLIKVNELLHKLFSFDSDNINGILINGEGILNMSFLDKTSSLEMLRCLNPDKINEIYKMLLFYHPNWIIYNIILNLDTDYPYLDDTADNHLLLGLTSIIDYLSNEKNENGGYTKRFRKFLEKNLSSSELKEFIQLFKFNSTDDIKEFNEIEHITNYIYNKRSEIVHRIGLKAIPFNIYYKNGVITHIVSSKNFRHLLWKSIFKYFELEIIDTK